MKKDELIKDELQRAANLRGLYVITDSALGGGHLAIARAAAKGGARVLQLRDKSARPMREILADACAARAIAHDAGLLFFVNDRLDLALACEADGVHLGPDDLPVANARRIAPASFLIGASCNSPEEARAAWKSGANLIGAGAVFGTNTKHDAGDAIGLHRLKELVEATPLPVAAIGGINANNIASVVAAGASLACVISAVTNANEQADNEQADGESAMGEAVRELVEAARF